MIFKNINAVFSHFYFLDFFEFLPYSVCIIKWCYFGFSAFWIVLNVLVQEVNVTEVEVFVTKKKQWQRSISQDQASLTHYSLLLLFYTPLKTSENIFYTPWKHEKTLQSFDVFRGYRKATKATLGCNELKL